MASNYNWFGRQAFMNAYHIIDKFHVIKNTMEQLQSVPIRYRQEELETRIFSYTELKCTLASASK